MLVKVLCERVQDVVVAFVLGEAGDGAYDEVIFGEAQRCADRVAIFIGSGMQKWIDAHAAADGDVLVWRADAAGEELLGHGVGDADDLVAVISGEALGDFVDGVGESDLGAAQQRSFDGHEGWAVDGVDGDGLRLGAPRGDATQDACLAAVRVHDVGLDVLDETAELAVGAGVVQRVDVADHVWNDVGCDVAVVAGAEVLNTVEQAAFGAVDGAEGEVDVVAAARLAFAGEDGVFLRAAENETG